MDYAQQYIDECGLRDSMPENLRFYFDYEKFARDLMISDICEQDGHYFHNW